jgi:hypothetical protein
MADVVTLSVNGRTVAVPGSCCVAVAIAIAGVVHTRRSVGGEPRGPLCGMGICFECRAIVDGVAHQRTCNLPVEDGMEVVTDA